MTMVIWASSSFKGEDFSAKCPVMAGNRAERGGVGRKREGCVAGWFFVCWDRVLEIT